MMPWMPIEHEYSNTPVDFSPLRELFPEEKIPSWANPDNLEVLFSIDAFKDDQIHRREEWFGYAPPLPTLKAK